LKLEAKFEKSPDTEYLAWEETIPEKTEAKNGVHHTNVKTAFVPLQEVPREFY
jgi:hypothetical protein